MTKNKVRIVGDVHGWHEAYHNRIKGVDHSIQLGDFGFSDTWNALIGLNVNPNNHNILAGNHDDYSMCKESPFYLGDFGNMNFHGMEFFFARGAYSVDKAYRTENISWWKEEEMSYTQMMDALNGFEKIKSDVVLTHDCPEKINMLIFGFRREIKNATATFLRQMYEIHQPKLWIFGHWHETLFKDIKGTTFVCLNELDYVDYDTDKDVEENVESIKNQIRGINIKKYLPHIY